LERTTSNESVGGREPLQGLPADPFSDLTEIKQEMEALHRRRMGTDLKENKDTQEVMDKKEL